MVTRRHFIAGSAAVGGTLVLERSARGSVPTHDELLQEDPASPAPPGQARGRRGRPALPPGQAGRDYRPVVTPNGSSLPYREVNGVKIYHLVAEEVPNVEMCTGMRLKLWGYNGESPGPTIEAVEGDRVRIYVTNRLPETTTVHWHGIILPNGMDGVGGLNQPPIEPGQTFRYEFTVNEPGTFMYHPHYDEMTQMGLGLMGMFVVHPRRPRGPQPDRDFAIMLNEWFVEPGASRPNTLRMDFNMLTMNHRAFPSTEALVAQIGDRVRMRFGNLSAIDHHPIHLHGYSFRTVATDGGPIPRSGQWPETTVLVPVGATRDIELLADNPGDWAMHCHMTHHIMNQMGHDFGNMVGADFRGFDRRMHRLVPGYMTMGTDGMANMGEHAERMPTPDNSVPMRGAEGPHGYIDMGGMFTVFKVRENLDSYEDPGWYEQPPGTSATLVGPEEARADGVDVPDATTGDTE